MATWNDFKKNITSIPPEEIMLIEGLAKLHTLRLKRGVTQQELAKRLG